MPSYDWDVSSDLVNYDNAVQRMETRVEAIARGRARPLVWLLSHPSVYTIGTSGTWEDILDAGDTPIIETGRGGQVTYHGPGQRVVYVMIPLRRYHLTLQGYLTFLGNWMVSALDALGVKTVFDERDVGVWYETPEGRFKVGFVGIRVRKGVSYHGFSVNVNPDLSHFRRMRPCGLESSRVSSLEHVQKAHAMDVVDTALHQSFEYLWRLL